MNNKVKLEKRYSLEYCTVNIGGQDIKVKKQIP